MDVQIRRRGIGAGARLRWGGIAIAVMVALVLGSAAGVAGRHYLSSTKVARPLPGVTAVQPQPIPTSAPPAGQPAPAPPPPDHILLQVPFTTQAPLNDWAHHQESCEAATLTMLLNYWRHDPSVVIDPRVADGMIKEIDRWKPQLDLNDKMMAELAEQRNSLRARWEQEKTAIARVRELKQKIEEMRQEAERAERMADFVRAAGVRLRPHSKTHKSPIIAAKQVALGLAEF